jgi:CheY-like chemotaxis protein
VRIVSHPGDTVRGIRRNGPSGPIPPPDLRGIHVLVVDDDSPVLEAMTLVLRHFGARVTPAASASAALAALQRERPDVLLSDLRMPGADGYDLVRSVRALPAERGGRIPAAAVSGCGGLEARRALRRGFHLHIAKPVDPTDLAEAVRVLARLQRGAAEWAAAS